MADILRTLLLFLIFTLCPNYALSETLLLNYVQQQYSNWCWAASLESIFNYYALPHKQCDAVDYLYGPKAYSTNCVSADYYDIYSVQNRGATVYDMQYVLRPADINSSAVPTFLSQAACTSEISVRRPFVIGLHYGTWDAPEGGHAVVGIGYSGMYINYIDPDPDNGGKLTALYNDLVSFGNHSAWGSSLTNIQKITAGWGNPVAETIDHNSVVLSGKVNTYGQTMEIFFEYGTTTGYEKGSVAAGSGSGLSVPVTATITGLLPNTVYHYRINGVGSVPAAGTDQTFRTAPGPTVIARTKGTGVGTINTECKSMLLFNICTAFGAPPHITLTAVPSFGSIFTGWSGGGCSGINPVCDLYVSSNILTYATFDLKTTTTVNFASGPNGSIMGTTSQTVPFNTNTSPVTAVPNTGYHFASWTGAGGFTSTANPLTLSNAITDQSITANFAINQYAVTFTAAASGSVIGATPQMVNHAGSSTAVTAVPANGYYFVNWTGPNGFTNTSNPLTVTNVTGATGVTANFAKLNNKISVDPASANFIAAPGAVTYQNFTMTNLGYEPLTVGQFSISGANSNDFVLGPTYCPNNTYGMWAGCRFYVGFAPTTTGTKTASLQIASNDATNPIYTVPLTGNGAVPPPPPVLYNLTVTKIGIGSGSVVSSPSGISCSSACTAPFTQGTSVTLTATPGGGSTFAGWTGSCSGTGACTLSLNEYKSVTASFGLEAQTQGVVDDGKMGWNPQNLPISASTNHSNYEVSMTISKNLNLRPGLIIVTGTSAFSEPEEAATRYGLRIDGVEISLTDNGDGTTSFNSNYSGNHQVELFVYAIDPFGNEPEASISAVSIPVN